MLDLVPFPSLESFTIKYVSFIGVFDSIEVTWPLFKLPSLTKLLLVETAFEVLPQFSTFFGQEHGVNINTVKLHQVYILKEERRRLPKEHRERLRRYDPDRELEDTSPPSPISSTPWIRPKLQTLEIVRGHASLLASWFIHRKCPFDLTALKTLKYEEDLEKNPDISDLGKLLQICAMSLDNLEICSPSRAFIFLCCPNFL